MEVLLPYKIAGDFLAVKVCRKKEGSGSSCDIGLRHLIQLVVGMGCRHPLWDADVLFARPNIIGILTHGLASTANIAPELITITVTAKAIAGVSSLLVAAKASGAVWL